jgi:hypothetical protein
MSTDATVIEIDISDMTLQRRTSPRCPLQRTEDGVCYALNPDNRAHAGYVLNDRCCDYDEDADRTTLNPMCPLLRGDVVLRRRT